MLICALVFTGGCASGKIYQDAAATIPPVPAGKGRIFFYRPSIIGYGMMPVMGVNGRPICKSKAKGCFFADCPPGICNVGVVASPFANFGNTGSGGNGVKILLKAGETRYIKIVINDTFLYIMDKEVGEKEIQSCKLQKQYAY